VVSIEIGDSAIRIRSLSNDSLVVDVDGWQPDETPVEPEMDETIPVDEVVSGLLTRVRVRASGLTVTSPEVEVSEHLGEMTAVTSAGHTIVEPASLPPATYRITIQKESLTVYAQFEGAVDVLERPDDTWILAFDGPTRLSVAVRDSSDHPRGVVTAAPTPEGVARAISTLAAGLRTATPDRSFPSLQLHPPRIELGERTDVPASVRERVPETDIELHVPGRIESLLAVAPLAHYLCATVTVADREQPVVRAPSVGLERTLPSVPDLSDAVSSLLERVFWLDCLVRNAGPHGIDLVNVERAREAGLDPDLDALYDASPAERLRRYLDLEFEAAADVFPRWQAAAVVEPTVESVVALPRLAFEFATVSLPDSGTVSDRVVGDASVPPTEPPAMGPGGARVGCRVTHGSPSGPLSATPDALRRFEGDDDDGPLRVVVGDAPGSRVGEELAGQSTLDDVGVRVERHRNPTRAELRAAVADPPELLYHALGGPDNPTRSGDDAGGVVDSGIECADGTLSVEDLPTAVADIVVLDTPASVETARELVGSGRAAAVVAHSTPGGTERAETETERAEVETDRAEIEMDRVETETDRVGTETDRAETDFVGRVGADCVRWLLRRARVGDALWLSRRYGEGDPTATAVGDVFRQLQVPARRFPSYYWYWSDGSGGADSGLCGLSRQGGHQIWHLTRRDSRVCLAGTPLQCDPASRELREALVDSTTPVVHDGRVYWDEASERLLNPLV
jgi:hypothetical protein